MKTVLNKSHLNKYKGLQGENQWVLYLEARGENKLGGYRGKYIGKLEGKRCKSINPCAFG